MATDDDAGHDMSATPTLLTAGTGAHDDAHTSAREHGPRAVAALIGAAGECAICANRFNKASHKPVACGFCPQVACTACVQQYLLSTFEDAHCLACKTRWPREFVDAHTPATFRRTALKAHREEVLFQRELALQPTRQPRAEALREADDLRAELTADMTRLRELRAALSRAEAIALRKEDYIQALEVYAYNGALATKPARPTDWATGVVSRDASKKAEAQHFVRRCPATAIGSDEPCRGFLSTAWKCGTCGTWACPDCHVTKGKDRDAAHTCNPDDVATAKLLAADTKPCPNCAVLITRVSGCSMMFCTSCHSGFDWVTMKAVTHAIHNPHYFEWLREQRERGASGSATAAAAAGAAGGDVCPGGLPDFGTFLGRLESAHAVRKALWQELARFIVHVRDVELDGRIGAARHDDPATANVDVGVRYLRGRMSADELKFELQKREKAAAKKREIRDVLEMFAAVAVDIINGLNGALTPTATSTADTPRGRQAYVHPVRAEVVVAAESTASRDLAALFALTNRALNTIGKRYDNVPVYVAAMYTTRATTLRPIRPGETVLIGAVPAPSGYRYGNSGNSGNIKYYEVHITPAEREARGVRMLVCRTRPDAEEARKDEIVLAPS